MSDWTWEYVPDAANVVGGLTQAQIDQVESLASRIADAVAVRRIGTPFDVTEAVSNVKSYGEGPVMIWFLEDYRDDVVLVVRVQHFELPDPTGLRHRHGHCVTQTTTQKWNHPCALLPRAGSQGESPSPRSARSASPRSSSGFRRPLKVDDGPTVVPRPVRQDLDGLDEGPAIVAVIGAGGPGRRGRGRGGWTTLSGRRRRRGRQPGEAGGASARRGRGRHTPRRRGRRAGLPG